MTSIKFQLVTPEKTILSDEVISLTVPTDLGQVTVLPGHAPLVATVAHGQLTARLVDGTVRVLGVIGGFLQVKPHNTVVVLADSAEHAHELDAAEIEAAVANARQQLAREKLSQEEYAAVTTQIERGLSHLVIARKHAHRHKAGVTGEGVLEE